MDKLCKSTGQLRSRAPDGCITRASVQALHTICHAVIWNACRHPCVHRLPGMSSWCSTLRQSGQCEVPVANAAEAHFALALRDARPSLAVGAAAGVQQENPIVQACVPCLQHRARFWHMLAKFPASVLVPSAPCQRQRRLETVERTVLLN